MARANSRILPRSMCITTGVLVLPMKLLSTGMGCSSLGVPGPGPRRNVSPWRRAGQRRGRLDTAAAGRAGSRPGQEAGRMLRRGDDYVAGLRDGRTVLLDGARVADVTTHPAFAAP